MSEQNDDKTKQWLWMMDYCKENRWAPENSYFWGKAKAALDNHLKGMQDGGNE